MKKAQFWYADFLLGLLILFLITFIFSRVIIDLNTREDKIQELVNDATSIANSLMSSGYLGLERWNNKEGRIGLVENGKIINQKLEDFEDLLNSGGGYYKSKFLLGTKNNYVMYFEDRSTPPIIVDNKIYGRFDNINKINELQAENLIKITRFVYYDNNKDGKGEFVKMIVLVWPIDELELIDEASCKRADELLRESCPIILGEFVGELQEQCCFAFETPYCCYPS